LPTTLDCIAPALAAWAEHLEVERDELLAMLSKLRFRAGRDLAGEREQARTLLLAAGVTTSDVALNNGISAVGAWVRDGRRQVTAVDVLAVVETFGCPRNHRPRHCWSRTSTTTAGQKQPPFA
jgi:hypothetical protein